MKVYSLQIDANNNRIVCKGTTPRSGTYRVVFTGSYRECQDHYHARTQD